MNEHNVAIAQMLRTFAEYLEMAEGEAKVKIGAKFKLKNRALVSLPVEPVDRFSAKLGIWASEEIMRTVKAYQQETGKTDGAELLEMFNQAKTTLTELTTPKGR